MNTRYRGKPGRKQPPKPAPLPELVEGAKQCYRCKEILPLVAFYYVNGKPHSYCRYCNGIKEKAARDANVRAGLRSDGKPRRNPHYQADNGHPLQKYEKYCCTDTRYRHLYQVFLAIHRRCRKEDPKASRYYDRGITVCDLWRKENWEIFAEWALANGWKEGLQIDRRDNDKGYCPENCRFVTPKENNANRDLEQARRAISEARIKSQGRRVRAIETGEVFDAICLAARAKGIKFGSSINQSIKDGCMAGGYHWEYV